MLFARNVLIRRRIKNVLREPLCEEVRRGDFTWTIRSNNEWKQRPAICANL